jgi:hypothetical protein
MEHYFSWDTGLELAGREEKGYRKKLREGTEGKWRGPVYPLIATKSGRETERDRLHKRRHCIHSKGQSKEQRSLY